MWTKDSEEGFGVFSPGVDEYIERFVKFTFNTRGSPCFGTIDSQKLYIYTTPKDQRKGS